MVDEWKFKDADKLKSYLQAFLDSNSQDFYTKDIHDLTRCWRNVILTTGEFINDNVYLGLNIKIK